MQELANTLNRKFKHSWNDVEKVLADVSGNIHLHLNTNSTIKRACRIAQDYKYSFYDSLIISAALERDCTILYSEDLNKRQVIEKKVKIVNPFV